MRVLALSAYAAGSHRYWVTALQRMFPHWQWIVLELPPRYFSWRVRGNPLYWAMTERDTLESEVDLVVATSMVDLATLRGLVPALSQRPTVLYFHENQFQFPQDKQRHTLLEAQMVSLYSGLAADRLAFNSSYNKEGFLQGCSALLRRLPDKVPPGVVDLLRDKAEVLPVPLRVEETDNRPQWPGKPRAEESSRCRLLWVGRFEHDKGGEGLEAVLLALELLGFDYELAMVGQEFRRRPPVFERVAQSFAHRIVHIGYIESRADYLGVLQAADIVLSTALHEFQGLAVQEAVAQGCFPVVPCRLVYPEIYGAGSLYESCPDDLEAEARSAASAIILAYRSLLLDELQLPSVEACDEVALAPLYQRMFLNTIDSRDSQ